MLPASIPSSFHQHSLSQSQSSPQQAQQHHGHAPSLSQSAFPPHFNGGGSPSQGGQQSQPSQGNNTTRILLLSAFSPELKTRDIQALFGEWEDDRGGFKIKWSDDESCWIVFNDAVVAKRAFLTLLSSPPPALQASETHTPKLSAYTGPDVAQILAAVQNRPRSRSINGGHSRKGSLLGSGGAGVGSGGAGGHTRNGSYGRTSQSRGSFGQNEMRGMMDQANGSEPPPPVPSIPGHLNGGDDSREGAASPPGLGRPQLSDAAQRHMQGALGRNGGHAKTGSGVDGLVNSLAGSSIAE
ncbi:hypothetical protein RQP46_009192 [Phenoliferia psychrophenolica]